MNLPVIKYTKKSQPVSIVLAGVFVFLCANTSFAANNAAAQLMQKMNQIQNEIQTLRNEVENQKFILNQALQKEKDRYIDIDQRLTAQDKQIKKIEQLLLAIGADGDILSDLSNNSKNTSSNHASQRPTTNDNLPNNASKSPSLTDVEAYNIASKLRSQRKFDQAEIKFKEFVKDYPNSRLTSNSYYWLGEIYMLQNKTEEAEKMFSIVANKYGTSNKALDAWYKLGLVQARYGNMDRARRSMQTLKAKHPNTPAGELAASWLKYNK